MKIPISLYCFILTFCPLSATTLVIDTFNQGVFGLSISDPASDDSGGNWAFGTSRRAAVSNRHAATGTTMTSTLDQLNGTLDFVSNGMTSLPSRALNLQLVYFRGGPFSLLGHDAFEFDFSSISGSGFLIVELGGGTADVYGSFTNRIILNQSGLITVPFSEFNLGTTGSIENFTSLLITFEAESEQFSLTLDEIRAVPEPSSTLLLLSSSLLFLRRRRLN